VKGSLFQTLGIELRMDNFTPTHLGKLSPIEKDPDKVKLDLIPNPNRGSSYVCRFSIPEFVSQCPATGQPDFATLIIDYVPRAYLLESKALKLWMFAFLGHGAFHEDVTVKIGKRFNQEVDPYWIRIAGFFNSRGGIAIDIVWEAGTLPVNVAPLGLNSIRPYHSRGA
jgi:7-cyano-7-deazaguanine reductase